MLLIAVGVFKAFTPATNELGPGSAPQPLRAPVRGATAQADKQQQVQDLLTECRSYAATDVAVQPDWARAEQACNKALDLEPINSEALAMVRRIQAEKVAADLYDRGQKNLQRLKEEEALDFFAKIPSDSFYYRKAKPEVIQAIAEVKKKAGEDCRRYVREGHPVEALPRCERYMNYACQDMSTDDLRPPVGYKLDLGGGRLKKREWRPKDAMYLTFLRTRAKVQPGAEPWKCPVVDIVRKGPQAESPEEFVKRSIEKTFADPILRKAVFDYWRGAAPEAIVALQRMRENMRYASLHKTADELKTQIANVDQLYKTGEGAIQQDDPERAAVAFDEALQNDQLLMKDQTTERPSFYRRNIAQDMAAAAYTRGKSFVDRTDLRRGCKVWQLGKRFWGGNLDLNRALSYCSSRAGQMLTDAKSCEDVANALEIATEGDGAAERAIQVKRSLGCPATASAKQP